MRGLDVDVDQDVKDLVSDFRYREHFRMSVAEYEKEPWEAIWVARTIWSLDEKRANLEIEKQRLK